MGRRSCQWELCSITGVPGSQVKSLLGTPHDNRKGLGPLSSHCFWMEPHGDIDLSEGLEEPLTLLTGQSDSQGRSWQMCGRVTGIFGGSLATFLFTFTTVSNNLVQKQRGQGQPYPHIGPDRTEWRAVGRLSW